MHLPLCPINCSDKLQFSRRTMTFFSKLFRPCVFSPGAYINNRSLMPCQEPPIAMSTWQASIHVPKGCVVLMSGNELPVAETSGDLGRLD